MPSHGHSEMESVVLTVESRVESPYFTLTVYADGTVRVHRPGAGEDELQMATFDVSQLQWDPLREQALEVIDPQIRYENYVSQYETDPWLPPNMTYDLSDDLDDDVPTEYRLSSPWEYFDEPRSVQEKHPDLQYGTGIEQEIYDELRTLSAGDLVRFGGGIEPHTVHKVEQQQNLLTVLFYPLEGEKPQDDPAQALEVTCEEMDGEFTASRRIVAWSYGPDEEYAVTGVITGAEVSSYHGTEYESNQVADIEWKVDPTDTAES